MVLTRNQTKKIINKIKEQPKRLYQNFINYTKIQSKKYPTIQFKINQYLYVINGQVINTNCPFCLKNTKKKYVHLNCCNNYYHRKCFDQYIVNNVYISSNIYYINCSTCNQQYLLDHLFPYGYCIFSNDTVIDMIRNLQFLMKNYNYNDSYEVQKKKLFYLFTKLQTKIGKKLIILYPEFAKVVKEKIMYFYYNHNIKEFYKIYRDIFNKRLPYLKLFAHNI